VCLVATLLRSLHAFLVRSGFYSWCVEVSASIAMTPKRMRYPAAFSALLAVIRVTARTVCIDKLRVSVCVKKEQITTKEKQRERTS
jgi:hypothetical protein